MTSSNESLRPASSKALGVGDQANLRLWWRLCLRSFTEFMFFFFFFGVDFWCFFLFLGCLVFQKFWWKKDGGKHAERLFYPNHWNLVFCEKNTAGKFLSSSFCWVSQVKHPRWRVTYGSSDSAAWSWEKKIAGRAKVLQQRAKHRARSKELLEEVATGKCQVKCHLWYTFSDPLGRSMIRIDISEIPSFFFEGRGKAKCSGGYVSFLGLYILNGRHGFLSKQSYPPWNYQFAPENGCFPKGNDRLPTIHFQGRTVSFTRWGSSRWRWRGHEALWCEVGFPGNPGQKAKGWKMVI